jgi:hypothetical protein
MHREQHRQAAQAVKQANKAKCRIREFQRGTTHKLVSSASGAVKTHSARTILIQDKATRGEVEGDGAVKLLIDISGGVSAQWNLADSSLVFIRYVALM